jgi:hypothetical protein
MLESFQKMKRPIKLILMQPHSLLSQRNMHMPLNLPKDLGLILDKPQVLGLILVSLLLLPRKLSQSIRLGLLAKQVDPPRDSMKQLTS